MGLESTLIDFSIVSNCLERINNAETLKDLLLVFQSQIEDFGFDSFTYWVIWSPSGERKPLYISSFRQDYSAHYIENDLKNIDPVWKHTSKTTLPFSWSTLAEKDNLPDTHKIVFNHGRDFNICSGATLPFYGPGRTRAAISVASQYDQQNFDKQFQECQHVLHVIGTYLHERFISLTYLEEQTTPPVSPTPREAEILLWSARGKTNWEIGEILKISENTVRNHIQNICQKYNVSNKTHAVTAAIMNGHILP